MQPGRERFGTFAATVCFTAYVCMARGRAAPDGAPERQCGEESCGWQDVLQKLDAYLKLLQVFASMSFSALYRVPWRCTPAPWPDTARHGAREAARAGLLGSTRRARKQEEDNLNWPASIYCSVRYLRLTFEYQI